MITSGTPSFFTSTAWICFSPSLVWFEIVRNTSETMIAACAIVERLYDRRVGPRLIVEERHVHAGVRHPLGAQLVLQLLGHLQVHLPMVTLSRP